jgi:hypothetical protein
MTSKDDIEGLGSLKFLRPWGEDTRAGRRGGWGVNIMEDVRHRIALLQ